jgi:tetrahydromethanopterin S-methyltransferase subunit G
MIKDEGITLFMVMDHMQGMEQRLMSKINGVDGKVDNVAGKLDRLEAKVDRNHEEAQRNHSLTMVAFDNIDERLDDIEVVQVPAIKKAVGMGK